MRMKLADLCVVKNLPGRLILAISDLQAGESLLQDICEPLPRMRESLRDEEALILCLRVLQASLSASQIKLCDSMCQGLR